jgi:hypothetical protein
MLPKYFWRLSRLHLDRLRLVGLHGFVLMGLHGFDKPILWLLWEYFIFPNKSKLHFASQITTPFLDTLLNFKSRQFVPFFKISISVCLFCLNQSTSWMKFFVKSNIEHKIIHLHFICNGKILFEQRGKYLMELFKRKVLIMIKKIVHVNE